MAGITTMPKMPLTDVHSPVELQSDRDEGNHNIVNPKSNLEGMQTQATSATSGEYLSNGSPNSHSVSTSLQSSSPRSSGSSNNVVEEFVVVFESKENYMNQETFDEAMRRHGIQEEVTHRIIRVESKDSGTLSDAQWDDPCSDVFPVRCVYQKLVRDFPEAPMEASPMPSLPSSMPTTPELPMRELAPNSSPLVESSLSSQSVTHVLETSASSYLLRAASAKTPAWYRVAFCGGISVREAPDAQAPAVGVTLPCNEVFEVSESIFGHDQRLYLKLATGCGWVFDDSLLFPDDPSVCKLQTTPAMASFSDYYSIECGNGFATTSPHPTMCGTREENAQTPQVFTHSVTLSTSYSSVPFATAPSPTHGFRDRTPGFTALPLASVPYQVQAPSGVSVLVAPDANAAPTGIVLEQLDVFNVCESIMGSDGRQYLRLADGHGWVLAETLPPEKKAKGMQAPLDVGEVCPSQFSSQQDDKTGKAKCKDSAPKAHVPYWVRLRRAKQLGVPMGQRKSKGGPSKT